MMTHPIYEPIQLTAKSLNRHKGIYKSLACTIEIKDKRRREDWMNAILNHQSDETGHITITTELCSQPEVSSQLQDLLEQIHVIRYSWAPDIEPPHSRAYCESSVRQTSARSSGERIFSPQDFAKTCATCALFKPFADGTSRGLCCGSNSVTRDYHP